MFFLAPALPYLGAGIAGLGAAARAAGSPQGQRFLQGGINTLNRFGTRLQDFLQPAGQMITQQARIPSRIRARESDSANHETCNHQYSSAGRP